MKKHLPLFILALIAAACGGKENPDDPTPTVAVPASPANLKLHSAAETSLAFQWDQVTDATSYDWEIQKDGTKVDGGSVRTRNVTVSGLTKATDYRFGVKAVNSAGSSSAVWLDARTAGTDEPVNPQPTFPYYDQFDIPSVEEDGVARAFPGAEGGGMYTTGGRGGKVLHVTTLEDSNSQGTLRWACTQNYPRIIVFDVAGTIELKSQLQINRDDCTVAGQTAPGDGICLKNYTFRVSASNVIVRFIRCRMGDEAQTEDDAIQVMSHDDDKYSNIIIDHCSVSWSTDECASFYGMKDFTFSWNIVSESLRNSVHDKGPHGYGGIWGGNNASYHHNLLAHHDSRNPRIDHDYVSTQKGPVTIDNNVVYNWEGDSCYGGESSSDNGSGYRKYNFFNNYYKPGPVTPSKHIWLLHPTTSCSNCGGTILPGHFYMDGNVLAGQSAITGNNWTAGTSSPVGVYINASQVSSIREASPFSTGTYQSVHSGQGCLEPVLSYAGASYARDRIDERIATETRNGTYTYEGSNTDPRDKNGKTVERSYKGLIDTQTDVAESWWKDGWPVYGASEEDLSRIKDSDGDGMPDWFETAFGLNRTQDDSAGITLDKNGRYTNLEMYLHYLVKDIVTAQNADGTYTEL